MNPPSGVGPLVLLVDDYADNRDMYARYLTFAGYRVDEATNGQEALDKAGQIHPDLIVMDLSLPVMDGWEATRRLKANPQTRRIPVLALTGHALGDHEREASEAGCDGYVTKPCLPEDLAARINVMLAGTPSKSRPRGRRGSRG
ncbi:MAG TPA: response regulator [Pseudomonadales bacterium]|nr:response regulator [Pseudomonadales bacterium]